MTNSGDTLGSTLLAMRGAAKLKQTDVAVTRAKEHGAERVTQPRLSRIEQGEALPTEEQLLDLARRYGATAEQVEGLLERRRAEAETREDRRLVIQRGRTLEMQRQWRLLESRSAVVRGYQPVVVLGSLQTPRYAAAAMGVDVDSPEVRDRMARKAGFDDPEHRHLLIQTEGALRRTVGSADVMTEQVRAIIEIAEAPAVTLGVIPDAAPARFIVGNAFHVYDDTAVVVGLQVAAATLTDADDIAAFRGLFDRLAGLAVWGEEAQVALEKVADWYGER